MKRKVTLYVPELLSRLKWLSDNGAVLSNNGLALWLSKGKRVNSAPLFNDDAHASTAALLATAKGYSKGKCYCLVSPIDCYADQHTVYIINQAKLTIEKAQAMVATLNAFLKEDDIQLEIINEALWLFVMKHHTEVTFSDISEVAGKSMSLHLPSGQDAVYWRRLLTECQMLLSQTVSVWFWGNGIDHVRLSTAFDTICTNDVILQAKGLNAGAMMQALPTHYGALELNTTNVLLTDSRFALNSQQDPAESLAVFREFEQGWIEPLLSALQKGQLERVTLVVDKQTSYSLSKLQLHYFWRKTQPLVSFIN